MATKKSVSSKKSAPSKRARTRRAHPIRVVPLYKPRVHGPRGVGIVRATAPPKLTYRGGSLIKSVKIFTIYWGSPWNQTDLRNLAGQLNDFFKFIVNSSLIDELAEYNVQGQNIGRGTFVGTVMLTKGGPRKSVKDASIRSMLQKQIAGKTVPQPTPDTLYFISLPPGVTVIDGSDASCTSFCGYHNSIGDSIFYAVMPYAGCNGCLGQMTPFDALTGTSSHELCEAITDAVPGTGWYDDTYGEIGDICAWKFKKIGQYTVQLEWSNKADSCI
jgi:hypothetical protein